MDRFATVNVSGRRKKLNTGSLCRCCGLEQDEKFSIIGDNPFNFDGIQFSAKYYQLLGIKVDAEDRMPQNICLMCSDKINDFYEFRAMAYNTESQTREIIGLPKLEPIANIDEEVKKTKNFENKIAFLERKLADLQKKLVLAQVQNKQISQKALAVAPVPPARVLPTGLGLRKRFSDQIVEKMEPPEPPKKIKKEFPCNLCQDRSFLTVQDLIEHNSSAHIPKIAKFGCASCHETFNLLQEFKTHQRIHSKTAYTCFICRTKTRKYKEFLNHLRKCSEKIRSDKTVDDIKCFGCKKKFLTQNLFEWHGCFIRTKGNCIKCGQYVVRKPALFKHYINCKSPFICPDFALDPIKKEATDEDSEMPENSKKSKKKIVPGRRMTTQQIVKAELQIDETIRDEADAEEGEIMNYEPEINYDGFQNDDDSDEEIPPNQMESMEPIVKMEKDSNPAVNIKQEKSSQSVIQQRISAMIRSIKQERVETESTTENHTTRNNSNPPLKLRIKAEKDEQTSIKLLNPLALKNKSRNKKVFKITPALLAKIKKEKIDREEEREQQRDEAEPEDEDLFSAPSILKIKQEKIYERDEAKGDNEDLSGKQELQKIEQENGEERDEAEAEDEDLLNGMATNTAEAESSSSAIRVEIKTEKMDSGYGDEVPKKSGKQLINPLALKNARKVNDATNEKSFVISSVTSINQNENINTNSDSRVREPGEMSYSDSIQQNEISKNNPAIQNTAEPSETNLQPTSDENNSKNPTLDEELDDLLRRCEKTTPTVDNDGMFDDLLLGLNGVS